MITKLNRRSFLQQLAIGAITTPMLLEGLKESLWAQEELSKKQLIWMQGQTGGIHSACRNLQSQLSDFLFDHFQLLQQNSQIEMRSNIQGHILILEGNFFNQTDKNQQDILQELTSKAWLVILLGNEACYSSNSPEGYLNLETSYLYPAGLPFIRLPGEPAQALHLLGTLNHLLLYGLPELDEFRKPRMFFDTILCDHCEHRKDLEMGIFAQYLGDGQGCLFPLGCKGQQTKNSCSQLKWNETTTWCVGVGHPCTGCSNQEYPNHAGLGLYGQIQGGKSTANSPWIQGMENLGVVAMGLTTAGVFTHIISQQTKQRQHFTAASLNEEEPVITKSKKKKR